MSFTDQRSRAIQIMTIIALPALLLLAGCSSTRFVRNSDDIDELTREGRDHQAQIIIADEEPNAGSWRGDAVTVAGDSLLWIDSRTGTIHTAHLASVRSVSLVDHDAGFWQGLGYGALAGLGVGVIGTTMSQSRNYTNGPTGSSGFGFSIIGQLVRQNYGSGGSGRSASRDDNDGSGFQSFALGLTGTTALGGLIGGIKGRETIYTFPNPALLHVDSTASVTDTTR